MKKTLIYLKITSALMLLLICNSLKAQTCSINTNVNGIGGTAYGTNNIGQSFTACGSGTLISVTVEASNTSSATAICKIFAGEGSNGTLLGTSSTIAISQNRTNTWDISSLNIKVVSGQKYTAMFYAATGTPQFLYGTYGAKDYYTGGVLIGYGAAINDMFFSANIVKLNPTRTPVHLSTNVSRNTGIKLQFDRAMALGTGNVIVKNVTANTTETISAANLLVSNTLVTIPATTPLDKNSQYEITIPGTAIKATSGVSFEGYTTGQWTFTTSNQATTTLSKSITSPTKSTTIPYTITFSESVTGLDLSDLVVTNGTASNLVGSGTSYTVDIMPTIAGFVKLSIPSDVTIEGNEPAKDSIYFDNIAPTVNVKNDTINLDATGNVSILATDINNGSTDNYTTINNLVLSLDKTSFTCNNLGANTVTLSVTDVAGNVGSTQATVFVKPKAPLLVPKNITVQLTSNGTVTVPASSADNGSVAYCGQTLSLSLSKSTFDCSNLGTNNVNLIGNDGKGNIVTSPVVITVQNKVLPTINTKDTIVVLDSQTGTFTLSPSMINNASISNCGTALTLSISKTKFSCTDLGANTVTLTGVDAQGNTNSSTATVTVKSFINDEDLTATNSTVSSGDSTTIVTNSSLVGVTYSLRDNSNNNVIGTSITGTGSPLSFNTKALTANTTFNVIGTASLLDGSSALDFDGTNDVVKTTLTNAATSTLTFEAWVYPRSTNYDRIISNYTSGGSGEFAFDTYNATDNGRGLRLYLRGPNTANVTVGAANVLNLNAWNHVAVTFDNGALKLYANGTLVATATASFTSIPASANIIAFGEDPTQGSAAEYLNGKLDEIRIWSIARTAAQIAGNMNNCLVGNEAGLKAYFKITEGSGSTTIDLKGNVVGTLTNMDPATDWISGVLNCPTTSNCSLQMSELISVTVSQATALINDNKDLSINIYPNPASEELNIESEATINNVEIKSILGNNIISENNTKINISKLSSGVYIIKIYTNEGTAQSKFIKK